MGMYSYFSNEEIEVKDWKGLNEFLELYAKEYPDWFKDWNMIIEEEGKKRFTFENWTDMKLISYWYDTQLIFLKCVAEYIEGEVYWSFENEDEAGWVEFRNGECIIHTGNMKWGEWKPDEELREIAKIPDSLKKLIIIKNLKDKEIL